MFLSILTFYSYLIFNCPTKSSNHCSVYNKNSVSICSSFCNVNRRSQTHLEQPCGCTRTPPHLLRLVTLHLRCQLALDRHTCCKDVPSHQTTSGVDWRILFHRQTLFSFVPALSHGYISTWHCRTHRAREEMQTAEAQQARVTALSGARVEIGSEKRARAHVNADLHRTRGSKAATLRRHRRILPASHRILRASVLLSKPDIP